MRIVPFSKSTQSHIRPSSSPSRKPVEEIDGERNFIFAAFQEIQKLSGLLVGQRVNLFFDDFGQNTRSRRIVTNVVEKDGLLEGLVQHAVNVLDGFGV